MKQAKTGDLRAVVLSSALEYHGSRWFSHTQNKKYREPLIAVIDPGNSDHWVVWSNDLPATAVIRCVDVVVVNGNSYHLWEVVTEKEE